MKNICKYTLLLTLTASGALAGQDAWWPNPDAQPPQAAPPGGGWIQEPNHLNLVAPHRHPRLVMRRRSPEALKKMKIQLRRMKSKLEQIILKPRYYPEYQGKAGEERFLAFWDSIDRLQASLHRHSIRRYYY